MRPYSEGATRGAGLAEGSWEEDLEGVSARLRHLAPPSGGAGAGAGAGVGAGAGAAPLQPGQAGQPGLLGHQPHDREGAGLGGAGGGGGGVATLMSRDDSAVYGASFSDPQADAIARVVITRHWNLSL